MLAALAVFAAIYGCSSDASNVPSMPSNDAGHDVVDNTSDGAPALDASESVDAGRADTGADANFDSSVDAATFCKPNEKVPCYEGPPGSDARGRCRKGHRECDLDGSAFGECIGQILPETERCDTPDDDDCNGLVNEPAAGCACTPGETRPCYPGPFGTRDIGTCHAGVQSCLPSGLGYGDCTGAVLPVSTDCASDADSDCDGHSHDSEDGCCAPYDARSCYSGDPALIGVGRCGAGVQICQPDGVTYGACLGERFPEPETCGDGVDNDCNGKTDESGSNCICSSYDAPTECYSGPPSTKNVGVCKSSLSSCSWGINVSCPGQVLPVKEDCATAADEDCDGTSAPPCMSAAWTTLLDGMPLAKPVPLADGGVVVAQNIGIDLWLTRLGATGQIVSNGMVATGFMDGTLVGIPGTNDVVLFVVCRPDIAAAPTIGGAAATCSQGSVVANRFDAIGNLIWTRGLATGNATVNDVTVDGAGNVYVAGTYSAVDALRGVVAPPPSNLGSAFVLKLNGTTGQLAWSRTYAGAGESAAQSIDVTSSGIVFGGIVDAGADLGSESTIQPGLRIAMLNFDGALLWSQLYPVFTRTTVRAGPLDTIRAFLDPSGEQVIAGTTIHDGAILTLTTGGTLAGVKDLGFSQPLVACTDQAMFVASYADLGFEPLPRWSGIDVAKLDVDGNAIALLPTNVTIKGMVTTPTNDLFMTGRIITSPYGRIGDDLVSSQGLGGFVQKRGL